MAGRVQRFFFTEMTRFRTWRDPVNGMYGGGTGYQTMPGGMQRPQAGGMPHHGAAGRPAGGH